MKKIFIALLILVIGFSASFAGPRKVKKEKAFSFGAAITSSLEGFDFKGHLSLNLVHEWGLGFHINHAIAAEPRKRWGVDVAPNSLETLYHENRMATELLLSKDHFLGLGVGIHLAAGLGLHYKERRGYDEGFETQPVPAAQLYLFKHLGRGTLLRGGYHYAALDPDKPHQAYLGLDFQLLRRK